MRKKENEAKCPQCPEVQSEEGHPRVILEFSNSAEIVSIITKESAERLDLAPGKDVYAVVKASNAMIAID